MPDALAIDFLVILQREAIFWKVKAVKAIADVFPVDKILGMKDDQPRHGMHGGSGEIIIVTHAQDIRVGKLIVEQRVGEGSVTIVGGPALGADDTYI